MKKKLVRALIFLRIIDEYDGNLSLTNIAVIVILTKLMCGTLFAGTFNLQIEDVIGVGVSLFSYQAKKAINNKPHGKKRRVVDSEE